MLLDVKQITPERHRLLQAVRIRRRCARRPGWRSTPNPSGCATSSSRGTATPREDVRALGERLGGCRMIERVELLPYHTLGVHKYEAMGLEYRLRDVKGELPEQTDRAAALLREYFATVIVN